MTRFVLLASATSLALSACVERVSARPVAAMASFVPAPLIDDASKKGTARPERLLAAAQRPAASGRRRGGAARSAPVAGIEAANRAATREPSRSGYLNASQVYAWSEGSLYRLYAAPERVSDIALQPGETLISVAAGDTVRWVIGDTTSGAGSGRRTHILVKPSSPGLRTNLVIATDRRVYHVQLESNARTAMASMSWTYPRDELLVLARTEAEAAAAAPVADGILIEKLDFNYRIEGDDPAWRPVRAFDDGRQVFIEFPPGLETGEAPPLFVVGAGGAAELVNYRLRGRYYVIDRLFSTAELRLGGKRQQVVRITRKHGKPSRRGRSS